MRLALPSGLDVARKEADRVMFTDQGAIVETSPPPNC
jgi:hypothetical protein